MEEINKQAIINHQTRKKLIKQRNNKLAVQLDRAMHNQTDFFKNRIQPDPIARELVNSLSNYKELNYVNYNFYPSNLIYFDEKITPEQSEEFISRLKMESYKSLDRHMMKIKFRPVLNEMVLALNVIRLFVSDFYSCDYLPGYLVVPYNFEYNDLILYYNENKSELNNIRKRVIIIDCI